MSLKIKRIIIGAIFVAAVLVALLYKAVPQEYATFMLSGAVILLAAGSVLRYNWLRCPHCKFPLTKFSSEQVCKNCGKRLD